MKKLALSIFVATTLSGCSAISTTVGSVADGAVSVGTTVGGALASGTKAVVTGVGKGVDAVADAGASVVSGAVDLVKTPKVKVKPYSTANALPEVYRFTDQTERYQINSSKNWIAVTDKETNTSTLYNLSSRYVVNQGKSLTDLKLTGYDIYNAGNRLSLTKGGDSYFTFNGVKVPLVIGLPQVIEASDFDFSGLWGETVKKQAVKKPTSATKSSKSAKSAKNTKNKTVKSFAIKPTKSKIVIQKQLPKLKKQPINWEAPKDDPNTKYIQVQPKGVIANSETDKSIFEKVVEKTTEAVGDAAKSVKDTVSEIVK